MHKLTVWSFCLVWSGVTWLHAVPFAQTQLPTLSLTPRQIIQMDEKTWLHYYTSHSHRGGAQGDREALSVYRDSLDQCSQSDLVRLSGRSPENVKAVFTQIEALNWLDLKGTNLRGPHGGAVAIGHAEIKAHLMHDLIVKFQGARHSGASGAKSLSKRVGVLWKQTAPSTWSNSEKAQIVDSIRREVAAWPLKSRMVILAYLNEAH